jgi:hypothetical protein
LIEEVESSPEPAALDWLFDFGFGLLSVGFGKGVVWLD